MATIRDVAADAGVSVSTVSIVLRGEGGRRKISQKTQERVREAAQRIGYVPQEAAHPARVRPAGSVIIGLFWGSSYRPPLMMRFISGLQDEVAALGRNCDIMLHPFEVGRLRRSRGSIMVCDAVIICNGEDEDEKFLQEISPQVPVVLHNRQSDTLCTVNVDNEAIGKLAARTFAARGHQNVLLLSSPFDVPVMSVREASFINETMVLGLNVKRVIQELSLAGGYQGGLAICDLRPLPDAVICISDALAFGFMRACLEKGVRVPQDIELLSVGDYEAQLEMYASTPLSVITLPLEQMAAACLRLAVDLIEGRAQPPSEARMAVTLVTRESCAARADSPLWL